MKNKQTEKIVNFIGDKVEYDEYGGTYLWGKTHGEEGSEMIGEVRGWGAIQHLFKDEDGIIDHKKAEQFQDDLGRFIAEAITEKINRFRNKKQLICGNCRCKHSNKEYDGYCSQSCFDE